MSIFDVLKSDQAKQEMLNMQKENQEQLKIDLLKAYDKKKSGIQQIKGTDGFEAIVTFFQNEKLNCENYFRKGTDANILPRLQGRYDIVCQFLTFIENLSK